MHNRSNERKSEKTATKGGRAEMRWDETRRDVMIWGIEWKWKKKLYVRDDKLCRIKQNFVYNDGFAEIRQLARHTFRFFGADNNNNNNGSSSSSINKKDNRVNNTQSKTFATRTHTHRFILFTKYQNAIATFFCLVLFCAALRCAVCFVFSRNRKNE